LPEPKETRGIYRFSSPCFSFWILFPKSVSKNLFKEWGPLQYWLF
jgi:hypothetical protein